MKDGKLNEREKAALRRAHSILNKWCDWESEARERADFDAVLDDVECSAASAAGLILDFLSWIDD